MARRNVIEQRTEELLEPIVKEYQYELVDVEYLKEGNDWYLRAYIDKEGGITINDCEIVSRAFSEILDVDDYIGTAYIFEVSSPGLGRPLKKEKDYARSVGEEVEIRTYRAINNLKEFRGILIAYDKETVTIEESLEKEQEQEPERQIFNRSEIALIRLAFDF